MSRLTVPRLLESLFRRWPLYVLPIVALTAVGVWKVQGQPTQYRSYGSINVSTSSLVATLTDVRGNPGFGYDTPAAATSKQLNSLLQTDQFVRDIASRAGLTSFVADNQLPLGKIRGAITSWASGPNLLVISGTFYDAAVAQRLANATIDGFVDSVVASNVGDSSAAVSFFDGVLKGYQADVTTARAAIDTWLKAHPAPRPGVNRPDGEQVQLKALNDDLSQATDRYNAALSKSESAQLSVEQAKSDVTQRLKVVDAPAVPTASLTGTKDRVLSVSLFLVLGLVVSAAAVAVVTFTDGSVRSSAQLDSALGLRLLGSVAEAGPVPLNPTKSELLGMGISQPRVLDGAALVSRPPAMRKTAAKKAASKPRSTTGKATRGSRARGAATETPVEAVPLREAVAPERASGIETDDVAVLN